MGISRLVWDVGIDLFGECLPVLNDRAPELRFIIALSRQFSREHILRTFVDKSDVDLFLSALMLIVSSIAVPKREAFLYGEQLRLIS